MTLFQAVKIQNGDLCEADQTRVLDDDDDDVEEEEGAVGGILEPPQSIESNVSMNQVNKKIIIISPKKYWCRVVLFSFSSSHLAIA